MSVSWIGGKRKSATKDSILKIQRSFFARQRQQKAHIKVHNVFQDDFSANDNQPLFHCKDPNSETNFLKRKKQLLHQRDWISVPDAPSNIRKFASRSPPAVVLSRRSPSAPESSQSSFTPLFSNENDNAGRVEVSKANFSLTQMAETGDSYSLVSDNPPENQSMSSQLIRDKYGGSSMPRPESTRIYDTVAWAKRMQPTAPDNAPLLFPDISSRCQEPQAPADDSSAKEVPRREACYGGNSLLECKPSPLQHYLPSGSNSTSVVEEVGYETLVSRLERACSPLPDEDKDSKSGTTANESARVIYTRPQHWPWNTEPVADEDDEIQEWE